MTDHDQAYHLRQAFAPTMTDKEDQQLIEAMQIMDDANWLCNLALAIVLAVVLSLLANIGYALVEQTAAKEGWGLTVLAGAVWFLNGTILGLVAISAWAYVRMRRRRRAYCAKYPDNEL